MVFLMDIKGHIFGKEWSTLKEQAMQGKEIKQLRHRLNMSQKEFEDSKRDEVIVTKDEVEELLSQFLF